MPQVQTATSLQTPKKRQRSREPDWRNFYKNGLPKEIIVIDDSPPPRKSASVEAVANGPRNDNGGANGAALRHAAKKRKRDDMYDPIYHIKAGPSQTRSPHYKDSNTSSTISTDRTTSAIQTTAATSLGSQYSNNGSRGYPVDDTQPGQKRKRVATRQQLANEAKRREIEINGDAFTNYRPPPRPPIKAPEVNVKVMQDVGCLLSGIVTILTRYRIHTPRIAKSTTMMDIILWFPIRNSRKDVSIIYCYSGF